MFLIKLMVFSITAIMYGLIAICLAMGNIISLDQALFFELFLFVPTLLVIFAEDKHLLSNE